MYLESILNCSGDMYKEIFSVYLNLKAQGETVLSKKKTCYKTR